MANHMTEGSSEGVDGVKIFTREWQPASEPHGVVVIYALDHRGRGRSEGERIFVKKFADWTKDFATQA
jgi:alpha-beta hydrolase superfamily lysophospholipase